jgi:SAM-dependent methyltransferase
MSSRNCPVCYSDDIKLFKEVASMSYYICKFCDVIFISPEVLAQIDAGKGVINYTETYWKEELSAARERSWGSALARVAEVFLYARIPIRKFIDIGSGPGYLLDALQYQLPSSIDIFYANEIFPPPAEYCTSNKNYFKGNLAELEFTFDAGCCIEVIEHLTPAMVRKLFYDLAAKSKENSIYIFNTGLSPFIKNENINYLDPFVRGHIMGWSENGLQILARSSGFQILPIPGKTWAFIAEYRPTHDFKNDLADRIWKALRENVDVLKDKKTGELLYILGLDTARAYV